MEKLRYNNWDIIKRTDDGAGGCWDVKFVGRFASLVRAKRAINLMWYRTVLNSDSSDSVRWRKHYNALADAWRIENGLPTINQIQAERHREYCRKHPKRKDLLPVNHYG